MKKVGIITINDNKNYGNRLQCFAMQKYLKSLDCSSENLIYTNFDDRKNVNNDQPLKLKMKVALAKIGIVKKIVNMMKPIDSSAEIIYKTDKIQKRIKAFENFNNRYISECKEIIKGPKVPSQIKNGYDYFVAGSDQIWNRKFGYGTSISYLRFAPKKKRIAISASFGVDEMPEKYKKQAREYLNGMNFISVREETGRQVVKSLTGKDCDVFLDPTMLVDTNVYLPLIENSQAVLPEKYVLCFFLGNLSEERKGFIENFASEHNLETVYLNCLDYPDKYIYDPCDFLKAIKNCSYMFTDSFHGCVFSILFRKQMFAMEREENIAKMSGRINTLFEKFNLKERTISEYKTLPCDIPEDHFDKIFEILEEERRKTTEKLRKIFV